MDANRALIACQQEIEALKSELARSKWRNAQLTRENSQLRAANSALIMTANLNALNVKPETTTRSMDRERREEVSMQDRDETHKRVAEESETTPIGSLDASKGALDDEDDKASEQEGFREEEGNETHNNNKRMVEEHAAPSVISRPSSHVSMCALSLDWIANVFLVEHPEIRSKHMTTGQVTFDLIRPAVYELGCRYVDLIDSRSAVSNGRRFYFVSHSWGRPFVELVDQIIEHFMPENQAMWRPKGSKTLEWSETFIWLDIFAINQNPGASQGNDLSQLQEVVEDAEQTLMILDHEGTILTRIWCLFEAWHTGRKRSKGAPLRLLSYGLNWQQLEKVFIDLDVAKAQATVKSDLEMILSYISSDVGLLTMTHQLKDALVDSVLASIPPESDKEKEGEEKEEGDKKEAREEESGKNEGEPDMWTLELSERIFAGARVCYLYGRYDVAEPLFRRDLSGCEKVLGLDHPTTLSKVNSLARLLQAQNRLSEAEPLFVRAMEGKERVLGPNDQETLLSINNLGILYQSLGKLAEAEALLTRALEGRLEILGSSHPDTLSSTSLLGDLFRLNCQHDRAEEYQKRAVEGREEALGPEHPDTLKAVHRLALVYVAKGSGELALPLCHQAIEGRRKVLGAEHKDTMESIRLLESVENSLGTARAAAVESMHV